MLNYQGSIKSMEKKQRQKEYYLTIITFDIFTFLKFISSFAVTHKQNKNNLRILCSFVIMKNPSVSINPHKVIFFTSGFCHTAINKRLQSQGPCTCDSYFHSSRQIKNSFFYSYLPFL